MARSNTHLHLSNPGPTGLPMVTERAERPRSLSRKRDRRHLRLSRKKRISLSAAISSRPIINAEGSTFATIAEKSSM